MHGVFVKESFDNLKNLLDHVGASQFFEKANSTPLTTTVSIDNGTWTVERKRPNKTVSNTFKSGDVVEFNTIKPGYIAKCKTEVVGGNSLKITSLDKDYTQTVCMEGGKLKEVITVKGVTGTRWSIKQ